MSTSTQSRNRRSAVKNDATHHIRTNSSAICEVLASPGSGKTHSLLERAEHLLATGIPARKILLLSFSNVAVDELRRRAQERGTARATSRGNKPTLPMTLRMIQATTVHALARQLSNGGDVLSGKKEEHLLLSATASLTKLARKGEIWGNQSEGLRSRRIQQLDALREKPMLQAVLHLFHYAAAANCSVLDAFKLARFDGLLDYQNILLALRNIWRRRKRDADVVHLGDMLRRAQRAVEKGRARFNYTHILVDEFQDCSPAQALFLATLASLPGRSLMVFGDPDQAIFGFAGGRYTPLTEFLEGVDVIRLPRSRRLTAENAALASAIAEHDQARAIRATRHGVKPVLITSADEMGQAKRIANDIQALIDSGVSASNIAVLGRVKALLGPVEAALLALGVLAHRLHGVRDLIHVMRVLRLVQVIERNVERKTRIDEEQVRRVLTRLKGGIDAKRWAPLVRTLQRSVRFPTLESRFSAVVRAYVTLAFGAQREDGRLVLHGLNLWATLSRSYSCAAEMRQAVKDMSADFVTIGTIHAAKGREWAYVVVVGATDGILPWHQHQAKDDVALAEERNLLYVAVTRAKDAVRLYHAPYLHARSRKAFDEISRFLRDEGVWPLMRKIRSRVPA